MEDLDLDLPEYGLLSNVTSLDFSPGFCGLERHSDLQALENNWVNCSDDFIDSLLACQADDDAKTSAAIQDHNYVGSLPKSPSSDSGHSSGSRSPYASTASDATSSPLEISPNELDEDLFGCLDLPSVSVDGSSESECVLSTHCHDVSIDLDLEFNLGEQELQSSQKVCLLSSLVLPMTVQDARTMSLTTVSKGTVYPELRLSDEEKELLSKEGVTLPTNMPLTKSEERILRSVRRRIRNKQSARNSRKKKQDYMDCLEDRVKLCTDEKKELEKKVTQLEKQNLFLMTQLRRLQNAMKIDGSKPPRTTTCVLVLVMSFALFIVPSLSPFGGPPSSAVAKSPPMAGRSRNLLEVAEAEESKMIGPLLKIRATIQDAVSDLGSQGWSSSLSRMFSTLEKEHGRSDLMEQENVNVSFLSSDGASELVVTPSAASWPVVTEASSDIAPDMRRSGRA